MSTSNAVGQVDGCIFCQIACGQDPKTDLLYQDEEFAAFRDIRPAAPHHYLIVPRTHLINLKSLTSEHLTLIDKLVDIGFQVLHEQGGDKTDVRMGFHCPPFVTVSHLHLHVIAPASSMGFLGRWIFRADSWWFKTVETFKASLDGPKL